MKVIFGLSIFLTLLGLVLWYQYAQHFNQDSKVTATSGIFFQTTLNLEEYKNVSTGNNLWGTFDRYTRSDRMGPEDALTVYCNKYCKQNQH